MDSKEWVNKACGNTLKAAGVAVAIGGAVAAAPVWLPAFGIASAAGALGLGLAFIGVGTLVEESPETIAAACMDQWNRFFANKGGR